MKLNFSPTLAACAATLLWLHGTAVFAQEPMDDEIPPPPDEEPSKPSLTPPSEQKSRLVEEEELAPPPEEGATGTPRAETAKPRRVAAAPAPKSKPLSADETIYVVQRKPVAAKWAFEIAPQLMQSVNDRFTMHTGAGVSGLFHFRENFALEATFGGLWGRDTSMTQEIRDKESLKPELVQLVQHTWFLTGDLQWSPIYGKVSIVDWILGQFSAYVSIGGGLMGNRLRNQFKPNTFPLRLRNNQPELDPDWKDAYDPLYDDPFTTQLPGHLRFLGVPQITATIGGGIRFYLTEWLGFRLELRDYVQANRVNHRFLEQPENTSTVDITNTYMVQFGVSFLTPRLPLGGGK